MKVYTDPKTGNSCCILSATDRQQLARAKSILLSILTATVPMATEEYAETQDAATCIHEILATNGKPPKDTDTSPEYEDKGDGNPMESK